MSREIVIAVTQMKSDYINPSLLRFGQSTVAPSTFQIFLETSTENMRLYIIIFFVLLATFDVVAAGRRHRNCSVGDRWCGVRGIALLYLLQAKL